MGVNRSVVLAWAVFVFLPLGAQASGGREFAGVTAISQSGIGRQLPGSSEPFLALPVQQKTTGAMNPQSSGPAPNWVGRSNYSEPGMLVAVAPGDTEDRSRSAAVQRLGAQLSVSLVSMITRDQRENTGGMADDFSSKVTEYIDIDNLSGIRFESYYAASGSYAGYWTLARLSTADAENWRADQYLSYRCDVPGGNGSTLAGLVVSYLLSIWPRGYAFSFDAERDPSSGQTRHIISVIPKPQRPDFFDAAIKDVISVMGGGRIDTERTGRGQLRVITLDRSLSTDKSQTLSAAIESLSRARSTQAAMLEGLPEILYQGGEMSEVLAPLYRDYFRRSFLGWCLNAGIASLTFKSEDQAGALFADRIGNELAGRLLLDARKISGDKVPLRAVVTLRRQDPTDRRFPIEISVNEASLSFGLKFRALVDPSTGSISDKEQASVAAQEIITALGQRFMDTNAVCLYCDDSAFGRFSLAFGQGRLLALAPAESALSLAGWYVFPDAGSTSIARRLLASIAEPVKTATATRKLKVFGLGSNAFSLADRLSSVTNTARAPSYYLAKTLVAAIQTDLALGSGKLPGSGVVEGFLLASLEMKSVMRGELGPAIDTMRSAFIEALPGDVRRAAQVHDAYGRKYLNQKGGGQRDLASIASDDVAMAALDADSAKFYRLYARFAAVQVQERAGIIGELGSLLANYSNVVPAYPFAEHAWIAEGWAMLGADAFVRNQKGQAFSGMMRSYIWSGAEQGDVLLLISKYPSDWASYRNSVAGTALFRSFYERFMAISGGEQPERAVSQYRKEYEACRGMINP